MRQGWGPHEVAQELEGREQAIDGYGASLKGNPMVAV
jgi:hypothetical protein